MTPDQSIIAEAMLSHTVSESNVRPSIAQHPLGQ